VLAAMEQHLVVPRPLRRSQVLWVPTWGQQCGVAEYTRCLMAHLPAMVTAAGPDPRALRLLHIQHEPTLFNNGQLLRTIQAATQRRAAVVVTEHAVTQSAQPWEREADALVVHTKRAQAALQARWPAQRVEHIPHGCPTWFPTRKPGRGRVIGVFGFLEHHKGYWQLLDVLRKLPDTELVMYCHAKRRAIELEWEASAAGLPVRRVQEFSPIETVAQRLAQEADILVFWYKEVPVLSASGAVRVGMATGVPVLTSRTEWFSDVSVATYQPDDLLMGVERLLEDTALRDELVGAAREYCHEHRWQTISDLHSALWQSLERA
jgi:glycosyltransferase involved in cell wall biosynthesis